MPVSRNICASTLLALIGIAPTQLAASQASPFFVAGGITYLTDSSTRDLTTSLGYHVLLGTAAPEQGLIGTPSLDIDWGRCSGHGNRIDSVGILYTERATLGGQYYYLLGIGSFYNNIAVDDGTGTGTLYRAHNWTIGGKGGLGMYLGSRFFLEASYLYSGTISGQTTNSFTGCLGVSF